MLVLSRKLDESIVIDGRIRVKIIRIEGESVKLGIEAPLDVPVHRKEIYDEIENNNREAATRRAPVVPRIVSAISLAEPDRTLATDSTDRSLSAVTNRNP
jgi:carbon storage regulator